MRFAGCLLAGFARFVCNSLLKPQIQERLSGYTVRSSDGPELIREQSVHRKIERGGLYVELEFSRRCLIPVICQTVRIPVLAELFIRTAARQG